jgi:hypothetical protein
LGLVPLNHGKKISMTGVHRATSNPYKTSGKYQQVC